MRFISNKNGTRQVPVSLCCLMLLAFVVHGLDLPERPVIDKYVLFDVNSITRLGLFNVSHPISPLDSLTIYDMKDDQYQSLSLDLFRGPDRQFGVSSSFDVWGKYGISEEYNDWRLDTAPYKISLRTQTLNASIRDVGMINDASLGRENVYTGFHFYKIDGMSASVATDDKTTVNGFLGARVDSSLGFGGINNATGFVQVQRNIGFRSNVNVSFERATIDKQLSANDLGLKATYTVPGIMVLNANALTSFGNVIRLSESRINLDYLLSPQNTPYGGYESHNPLFPDTLMSVYFFNIFDYQKAFAGWRFKPFLKKYIFVEGEYDFMRLHDLNVHMTKLSVTSPYVTAIVSNRFGDLSGAGLIDLSGNYPVHRMLTIGAGANYSKLDIYYNVNGASAFKSYYGFVNFRPFTSTSLRIQAEDRSDVFVAHDLRLFAELIVGYTNQKSLYFSGNRQ